MSDLVRVHQHGERVAVLAGVVTDAAGPVPVLDRWRRLGRLGHQVRRRQGAQTGTGREQRRIQEIAAGDGLVHAQRVVVRIGLQGRHVLGTEPGR
jgi:hypothetical protein